METGTFMNAMRTNSTSRSNFERQFTLLRKILIVVEEGLKL